MEKNPIYTRSRSYSQGTYETSLGGLVVSLVFLAVATLSSLMVTFDFKFDFIGLRFWGFWLFIPGFIILLASIGRFNMNRTFQNSVRNAIFDRSADERIKLEEIALEVGLKSNDVLRVLLDLRNKGHLSYKFDSSSGEIIIGDKGNSPHSYGPPSRQSNETLPKGKAFCQYCGYTIDKGAIFCEYCGSKLT